MCDIPLADFRQRLKFLPILPRMTISRYFFIVPHKESVVPRGWLSGCIRAISPPMWAQLDWARRTLLNEMPA